jgi:hypothetical protein
MTVPLPKTYRGPIFITDIDETLRNNLGGVDDPPIEEAKSIVWEVARKRVPIVYLTAAEAVLFRPLNRRFLRSFPLGILFDRPPGDESANERYKARILKGIAQAYPRATFVCMGDNLTGDAIAYQVCKGPSFIRKVSKWHQGNTPSVRSSQMTVYNEYTEKTKKEILAAIRSLQQVRSLAPPGATVHLPGKRLVTVGHHRLVNRLDGTTAEP